MGTKSVVTLVFVRLKIGRDYWWTGMYNEIKIYVRSCHTCQMVKPSNHPFYGELQPLVTPSSPMDLLSMDTVVMDRKNKDPNSQKYIQIVLDHNSRYVWARATNKTTAQTMISVLDAIIKGASPAKRLLTDNYKSFRAKTLQRFLDQNHCSRSFTSSYHPQTNGANEKVNDTIVKGLRLALQDRPRVKWTSLLEKVVRDYNNTIHETTGFTPSYLMFGTDSLQTSSPSVAEARQLSQTRSDAFKQRKKEAYDRLHQPINLKVGDLVKRRIPSNRPDVKKLSPKFEGPFCVKELRGPVNVVIEDHASNSQPLLVHVSQIEPYYNREDAP